MQFTLIDCLFNSGHYSMHSSGYLAKQNKIAAPGEHTASSGEILINIAFQCAVLQAEVEIIAGCWGGSEKKVTGCD